MFAEVPAVVTECISEIEARGLMSEGIYRVPGSQDQVGALKLAFERGEAVMWCLIKNSISLVIQILSSLI